MWTVGLTDTGFWIYGTHAPGDGRRLLRRGGGCLQILPNGDVRMGSRLVWKNDVTAAYRGDSVRATQAHFISCLASGAPFESGGREYLHTFAAVEAAYRSIAERREVALSEIGLLTRV